MKHPCGAPRWWRAWVVLTGVLVAGADDQLFAPATVNISIHPAMTGTVVVTP